VRGGEQVIPLNQNGELPMGIFEQQAYGQATQSLEGGDLLLLYTDGITEAMAPGNGSLTSPSSRELFGVDRLDQFLLTCGPCDPAGCLSRIHDELTTFCAGTPPTDDQTLIALRCL
jgi:sigma-B regulation protein RsbU (phosphoserine phosphatase)